MTMPGSQALPPKGGWRVVSQTPGARVIPGVAAPVSGYTVTFVTGTGATGNVFIGQSDYTPDNVKAAIAAQAATLDAIANLDHTG